MRGGRWGVSRLWTRTGRAAGQDVPVPVQAGFDRYVVRMDRDAEVAFTVRLSRPCAEELGLALQPVAGEAREGEDFLLSTGELVFAPGETVKRFTMAGMGLSPYDELLALHLVPNVGEAGASCGYVVVQIRKNTEGEPESVAGNLRDAGDCRIVYDSGRGTLAVDGRTARLRFAYTATTGRWCIKPVPQAAVTTTTWVGCHAGST